MYLFKLFARGRRDAKEHFEPHKASHPSSLHILEKKL